MKPKETDRKQVEGELVRCPWSFVICEEGFQVGLLESSIQHFFSRLYFLDRSIALAVRTLDRLSVGLHDANLWHR